MRVLKQSTARDVMLFLADSADHVTGKTGLTLALTLSKAGGAFAGVSPTVAERGSGWYAVALTAAHTDTLGDLALRATAAGADPADALMQVVAYDPADATRLGLLALPNAAAGVATGLPRLNVNLRVEAAISQAVDANVIAMEDTFGLATQAGLDAVKARTDNLPAAAAGASGGLPTLNAQLNVHADLQRWVGSTPANLIGGNVGADIQRWVGSIPLGLVGGSLPANVYKWAEANVTGMPLPTSAYAAAPGAAAVATAVRTELATELGRLDAATSTRLAAASYVAPDNAGIAAVLADTGTDLPALIAAGFGDVPTAAEAADALLGRNLAGGADGGRTVRDALRAARNRVAFDVPAAGQFTVFAEDDSTPAWVGTYARGANTLGPLTAVDPTG